MKFIIDRSKWRSGSEGKYQTGKGITSLLNRGGFMCCLGHCALQLGASKKAILNKAYPNAVEKFLDPLNESRNYGTQDDCYRNTELSNKAATINDDTRLTLKERESKLRSLFAKYGHKIVFKGKSVRATK